MNRRGAWRNFPGETTAKDNPPSPPLLIASVRNARRRPDCDCLFIQGCRDWLSRWYFRDVDARVHAGHLSYLADPPVLALAAGLEVVFHFSDGAPEGHDKAASAENFRRVAYVPYDEYLPRYDLIVHHAGTGILFACLRHGKTAAVFPVDCDQFDQAARLEHAALARRLRRLPDLADAVRTALADHGMRERCEAFRARTAAADVPEERIAALVRARLRL